MSAIWGWMQSISGANVNAAPLPPAELDVETAAPTTGAASTATHQLYRGQAAGGPRWRPSNDDRRRRPNHPNSSADFSHEIQRLLVRESDRGGMLKEGPWPPVVPTEVDEEGKEVVGGSQSRSTVPDGVENVASAPKTAPESQGYHRASRLPLSKHRRKHANHYLRLERIWGGARPTNGDPGELPYEMVWDGVGGAHPELESPNQSFAAPAEGQRGPPPPRTQLEAFMHATGAATTSVTSTTVIPPAASAIRNYHEAEISERENAEEGSGNNAALLEELAALRQRYNDLRGHAVAMVDHMEVTHNQLHTLGRQLHATREDLVLSRYDNMKLRQQMGEVVQPPLSARTQTTMTPTPRTPGRYLQRTPRTPPVYDRRASLSLDATPQ